MPGNVRNCYSRRLHQLIRRLLQSTDWYVGIHPFHWLSILTRCPFQKRSRLLDFVEVRHANLYLHEIFAVP